MKLHWTYIGKHKDITCENISHILDVCSLGHKVERKHLKGDKYFTVSLNDISQESLITASQYIYRIGVMM